MIELIKHEKREYKETKLDDGIYTAVLSRVKEAEKKVFKKPDQTEPVYRLIFSMMQDGEEEFAIKDVRPSVAFKPKVSGLAAFLRTATGYDDNSIEGLTSYEVAGVLGKCVGKKFNLVISVNESKGMKYANIDNMKLDKSEKKVTLEDLYEGDVASDEIPF